MIKKRTLITSALPYANGFIHLGHVAGAYLPADIYARFQRLSAEETLYICGSDEHGVAITIAAEKEKVTPKDIIDKYHEANKAAFDKLGITFNKYSRTSIPEHRDTAREFFGDFLKKGFLNEKEEEQFYDEKAKMFLPDRYVEGICPNCGADGARGDQCDACGAYYDQTELKDPKSLVSGDTPIAKKTTHWYLKFGEFQKFLEKYIESNDPEWKDNVLQQSRSWLKLGLTERAITRDLTWGIDLKGIEGIDDKKAEGKALYVWFDAVLGYISATKELMKEYEKAGKAAPEDWKNKWWQNDDTRYLAFIGKDNIVFHTLIFPAMLHGKGENYILPTNVPANEFLNLEGRKFSKSKNWSIDLQDFFNDFPDKFSVDALRYAIATNFPETKDADFTWKDYQARNNNELAAIFGNFVNRSMQFTHKNFDGKIPELSGKYKDIDAKWADLAEFVKNNPDAVINKEDFGIFNDSDLLAIRSLVAGIDLVSNHYNRFRFRDAITETMNIARAANKYFNDEQPWKTAKNDPEGCAKTLYICAQLVRSLAVVFAPIVPNACALINDYLGIKQSLGEVDINADLIDTWASAALPILKQGAEIKKPAILFHKVEDETVTAQTEKLGEKQAAAEAEKEELITFDEFMKVKLRTAKIIEAEKLKKSKKLLKLQVDLGGEKRQILAGVAEFYKPEDLVGKIIVVVANLQPAKIMGTESQGMMLAASTDDGKLCFVTPEKSDIGAGAEVR
ncbi:MAG: methionine--tRNA ligase [Candidatus Kapabacteria bacterium]|jgi:methionyl-tRNA synthetase|nr:methionine--tRNA ligase [Candidatus Kapabacteria bacterium]